jgi:hypothetical protein
MHRLVIVATLLLTGLACVEEATQPSEDEKNEVEDPRCFGSNAAAALESEPDVHAVWMRVREAGAAMDRDTFAACYAPEPSLPRVEYDALAADYLDSIDAELMLRDEQLELLAQNGFVVLDHIQHPSFEGAYSKIYDADLPVLVTSDSLLYALHRSFDSILQRLEDELLQVELAQLLEQMHAELPTLELPPELEPAARDLDVYLAVARSLLSGSFVHTHGGNETDQQLDAILEATEARVPAQLELFGVSTIYDYSQFEPRGHYVEGLERYFQAMVWLGRTELPLITYPGGVAQLERRGVEAAVLLGELLDHGAGVHWNTIESVLRPLVGEPDSMSPATLDAFRLDAELDNLQALVDIDDASLQTVLTSGRYGVQRILSQIVYTEIGDPQYQLPQVFALFGQRFAIDSYVFNAVTYDRIVDPETGAKTPRMLPHEFDVAFALGSNTAGELLGEELDDYAYQGILHGLRFLIDGHEEDFWRESIYNGWLHAIRALDDPAERAEYPAAMRTEAWARKTLNTQLAAWAELRHDTIAYTKQSYSGGVSCEYPQAYVEPVPSFYARMRELARQGQALSDSLAAAGHPMPEVAAYFDHMADVMLRLERIAGKELDGVALDDDDWQFLRATIEAEKVGCSDDVLFNGWYGQLLFDPEDHGDFHPTIADVHTAPTDADGNEVGWVLHAATGYARYMVFTVEDCSGTRAYVGPVSTFHRKRTDGYQRLDDDAWRSELWSERPSPPQWTQAFAR